MDKLEVLRNKPVKVLRDRVIQTLQDSYAHDLLEEQEFEERLGDATNSANRAELMQLIHDLPLSPETNQEKNLFTDKTTSSGIQINTGKVKPKSTLISIMSATERKGIWKPAKRMRILNIMAGTDLDFTKAIMPPGKTTITITCIMGGIDIIVPKGINVETRGVPIMAGIENKTDHDIDENAPTLRINAVVVMGGIEIKHPEQPKHRKRLEREED